MMGLVVPSCNEFLLHGDYFSQSRVSTIQFRPYKLSNRHLLVGGGLFCIEVTSERQDLKCNYYAPPTPKTLGVSVHTSTGL